MESPGEHTRQVRAPLGRPGEVLWHQVEPVEVRLRARLEDGGMRSSERVKLPAIRPGGQDRGEVDIAASGEVLAETQRPA